MRGSFTATTAPPARSSYATVATTPPRAAPVGSGSGLPGLPHRARDDARVRAGGLRPPSVDVPFDRRPQWQRSDAGHAHVNPESLRPIVVVRLCRDLSIRR